MIPTAGDLDDDEDDATFEEQRRELLLARYGKKRWALRAGPRRRGDFERPMEALVPPSEAPWSGHARRRAAAVNSWSVG